MSKSAFRFFMLLGALILPGVRVPAASAGVINPYSEDIHTEQLWETDVTDPGDKTSAAGPTGNFNFSPQATAFLDEPTGSGLSTSETFMDETLFSHDESGLLHKIRESETTVRTEQSSLTTEDFNFPVPEPGSLTLWILLGLCGGFLIRRKVKS